MDKLTKSFNEKIDFPSTLFVTDGEGNILISNEFTALTIGMSLDDLLKSNVKDLVTAGYYDHSITLDAIARKEPISRRILTNRGFNVLSTATPIIGNDGEVQLIVTKSAKYDKGTQDEQGKISVMEERPILIDQETAYQSEDIVAESLAMKQILRVCLQIASYDSKVLICGESGTGKEVIARYIHQKSDRANGPFIKINCAAIPKSMFEYELFGYEQDAYGNGVKEKQGLIELANDGVLFLDEISEMPLDMQSKLLHVLETNELRRVGGTAPIPVNGRIIAATNQDLWTLVQNKKFREDLYYRINVIPIHIPPLRNRKPDLAGLISKFLTEYNQKYNKEYILSAEEFHELLTHSWPGNVRELKNYMERLILTVPSVIAHSKDEEVGDWFAFDYFIQNNFTQFGSLKDFTAISEGRYIEQVLASCNGNATTAANKLGIHRSVIYRKLKKMEETLETIKETAASAEYEK
ncbi:sigma-54 interaction domain-containing protein [Gracilibacillus sp. Marseille-QA3620]